MATFTKKERKQNTFEKAKELFANNDTFILVDMNNVTAQQLQNMKQNWRGNTDILLGKNTVIKKALEELAKENEAYNKIIELIKMNVAFIFSKEDMQEIKKIMLSNSRNTYASIGMIAQEDVWIKKHITSMGPERTKYFQALNIFTQITKGKVEIKSDCKALSKGDKVGPSQANLLTLLDIKPFTFHMNIIKVYDGGIFYEPWIVDITSDVIEEVCRSNIKNVGAIGLGCGISNEITVPYEIINNYKNILGISLGSGFIVKETEVFC
ncbi:ribosomal protein P0 (A0) (L10E) [Binucleata daphniae]